MHGGALAIGGADHDAVVVRGGEHAGHPAVIRALGVLGRVLTLTDSPTARVKWRGVRSVRSRPGLVTSRV